LEQANRLARLFYAEDGHQVPRGYRFDLARDPGARACWQKTAIAFRQLRDTNLDNLLSGLRGSMTRAKHLAWAKARALDYADRQDMHMALASVISDLGKHAGWAGQLLALSRAGMLAAIDPDPGAMRRWIESLA
jgi:hypothetical protein